MSSEIHKEMRKENKFIGDEVSSSQIKAKRVNLTDLVARMNDEKSKEKKSNLILSAAAISAVTVFGIILTL